MVELAGMRLAVVGAGVFGLCTALRAAASGAAVEIFDPCALGDNASGVAAGMIAPVGEALFDPISAGHFPLFLAARERWRDLERLAPDLKIDRSGARFLFDRDGEARAAATRLQAMGAATTALDADASAQCAELGVRHPGLFTPEDWRVDAPSALAALKTAVIQHGGVIRAEAFAPDQTKAFDALVVAAGLESRSFAALAPELDRLSPIKGQIVRFAGGPADGPTIRTRHVYLAPSPGGVLAGATMEPGRDDRMVEALAVAELRDAALRLAPDLASLPYQGFAGVRAATPDGLPLAGPSSRAALYIATGARRNGWLFAPLVSQILVSYLSGGDGGPFAGALDPRRFSRA